MCVSLDESEPVDSVLTFPSEYDTLEYSWVKVTAVSVCLRILFVTLQSTNNTAALGSNLGKKIGVKIGGIGRTRNLGKILGDSEEQGSDYQLLRTSTVKSLIQEY